jgi:chitinase
MKIIYYYQTFCGLKNIINDPDNNVSHIHVSSIHFDKDCIHLNDNSPYSNIFNTLWNELKIVTLKKNITIILMVGGAGGAFQQLFVDFEKYYKMLFDLIDDKKDIIKGVDLDIEEEVDINNVIKLINRLKSDFGKDFIISMAPIESSLETDNEGMGGFIYKDLFFKVGGLIDYFNVQCYYDYSEKTFDTIVKNGYPPEKINMGMMSYQYNNNVPNIITKLRVKYNFGGIFDWEYNDAVKNWNHLMDDNKSDYCSIA